MHKYHTTPLRWSHSLGAHVDSNRVRISWKRNEYNGASLMAHLYYPVSATAGGGVVGTAGLRCIRQHVVNAPINNVTLQSSLNMIRICTALSPYKLSHHSFLVCRYPCSTTYYMFLITALKRGEPGAPAHKRFTEVDRPLEVLHWVLDLLNFQAYQHNFQSIIYV